MYNLGNGSCKSSDQKCPANNGTSRMSSFVNFRKDMARLNGFLATLPQTIPSAMEFRHVSWFDDEVFETLTNRNIALCVSDDGELALPDRIGTTSWLYLRLRRQEYDDAALRGWLAKANATSASRGYAFFKHEDDAGGPPLAARFLQFANGSTKAPKASPEITGSESGKRARKA